MDAGDLEYNRRGLLGPGQRARLQAGSDQFNKWSPFGPGVGPGADMVREFQEQVRQAIEDGRVTSFMAEVRINRPAFSGGGSSAPRTYADPRNYESAYSTMIDGGGSCRLAPWLNLLPGRYQIFVAPRAGFVVGASPLPPLQHALTFFVALCAAQNISAETLAENRRGRMTEAQQRGLKPGKTTPWIYIVLAYGLGALSVWWLVDQLVESIHMKGPMRESRIVMVLILCAFLVVIFFAGTLALMMEPGELKARMLDIREGRVEMIEGPLGKAFSGDRHSVSRDIKVGPLDFDITKRPSFFDTLIPGFVYRAYFTPRSKQLLAIELLSHESTIAVAPL